MKKRILFVNHIEQQCGVHQFGEIIGMALLKYAKDFYWNYSTIETVDQYWNMLKKNYFDAIIFNYHPGASSLASSVVEKTEIPTFGIVHEESWFRSDPFLNKFQYLIYPDPTSGTRHVLLGDRVCFATSRTIPDVEVAVRLPNINMLTVGSFGFAFGGKGYYKIVDKVQEEFDEALIRLHIPFARFGDEFGKNAEYAVDECNDHLYKPGVKVKFSHNFLERQQLIRWLSENHLNCFFYDSYPGRGNSSTIDFALAARRPIAITDSNMFRHIKTDSRYPSIRIENSTLKEILKSGIEPLKPLYKWTEENTLKEYENIMREVLK